MCLDCDERAPIEKALDRVRAGEEDPACRSCGGILKTATISFGQGLVAHDLARADGAARRADVLFAVGTTLGGYPIANLVPLAKAHGSAVDIVDGGPIEMDRSEVHNSEHLSLIRIPFAVCCLKKQKK